MDGREPKTHHTSRCMAPPYPNMGRGATIFHKIGHGLKPKSCHQYPPRPIFDNTGFHNWNSKHYHNQHGCSQVYWVIKKISVQNNFCMGKKNKQWNNFRMIPCFFLFTQCWNSIQGEQRTWSINTKQTSTQQIALKQYVSWSNTNVQWNLIDSNG